jgi:hypothetical protein
MNLDPKDTFDLALKAALLLVGWGGGWAAMKMRTRSALHAANAAGREASAALKAANDAAHSAADALRLAADAARSAAAAHKRLDDIEREHGRRLTTLEVVSDGTQRELSVAIARFETLVRDSIARVEDMVTNLAQRIDRLAERRAADRT